MLITTGSLHIQLQHRIKSAVLADYSIKLIHVTNAITPGQTVKIQTTALPNKESLSCEFNKTSFINNNESNKKFTLFVTSA